MTPASPPSLSSAAAAVLGLVALGARSGYEIRRATERSLRFFWALSPPQIYAELKRLEDAGLLAGRDEATGGRPRRLYAVTDRGTAALRAWLRESPPEAVEIRDTALLRLFFADVLDADEAVRHVAGMRERSASMIERFDREILPAAARTAEAAGARYPGRVAAYGRELHVFIVDWCDRLLAELA